MSTNRNGNPILIKYLRRNPTPLIDKRGRYVLDKNGHAIMVPGRPIGAVVSDGKGRVGFSICNKRDLNSTYKHEEAVLESGRKINRRVRTSNGWNRREAVRLALETVNTETHSIPDRNDVGGADSIRAEIFRMLARSYRYYR